MAHQIFKDAITHAEDMTVFAPDGREFKGYYCDPKVNRKTLLKGWHAYDIRHDDECLGFFVELCHNYVLVNNAGTFLCKKEIPELSEENSSITFRIDPEDWKLAHTGDASPIIENENDWDYSF